MYYRLKEDVLLRGWQLLPYAVVNAKNGKAGFVNQKIMEVLELANGQIDFDIPLISDEKRKIAEALVKEGLIVPCENSGSIEEKQKYRFYDNRYIASAHWSITGRCNYKCKHCFMWACENKFGELSHEQVLQMVGQLSDCGIFRVSLTGGEAMLRKDFFDIVDALTAHDIILSTVYSNGHLVNEKNLAEFEKRGLHPEFNMSFDGTEGWHEWLRGVPGADKAIEKAFRLCKEHGFPTGAEMCLHEKNKHTLRDSVNYLAGLGCMNLKTSPISDIGAWHDGGYGKAIELKDLYDTYISYIPQYYADGMPLYLQLGGFFSAGPNKKDKYYIPYLKKGLDPEKFCVCGHARNNLYISAEGRALPCMPLSGSAIQENYPMILESSLKQCLSSSYYMDFITKKASEVIRHNERCRTCEYAAQCCGGCRAAALDTSVDDILAPDEQSCLLFKGGYIDKIDAAVKKGNTEAIRG